MVLVRSGVWHTGTGVAPACVTALAGAVLLGSLAVAQDVAPTSARFTVAEALRALESDHPALAAARAQVTAAAGDAVAIGLWDNPAISGARNTGVGASASDTPTEHDWSISQNLDVFKVRAAARQAARLERDATEADYQGLLASLRLGVERAFIAVVAARQRRQLEEDTLGRFEEAFRIVQARVQAGAEPRYDGTRMALGLASVRADAADARADQTTARTALDVAVGPGARTLVGEPAYALFEERSVPALAELMTLAASRPDLAAARLRAQSAERAVIAARRGVWPSFSVSAGESEVFSTPRDFAWNLGVSVTVPLFNRGQGTRAAARARAAVAAGTASAIDASTRQALTGAYSVMTIRRQAVAAFRDAGSTIDDTMLREAQAAYQGGAIEILDLIDAYSSYHDTRARAIDLATSARGAELDTIETATVPGATIGGSGD